MRPPWFACNGWWSPWCYLDVLTDARFDWISRRHTASITRGR